MGSDWSLAVVATAVSVASCSQPVDAHPSPPAAGQYQIDFPSVLAAVDSDSVEVYQFDATQAGADCLSLMVARSAKAALPAAPALLADTGAVDTCSLTPDGGSLGVTFGQRSLLVVTQRCGQDLLLGCAQTDFAVGSGPVTVYLALSKIGQLPANGCTSLSQKCGGGCPPPTPACDGGT
jgi:hypothetical protein